MTIRTSMKAARFEESVIREMTRLFISRQSRPGASPGVNLAQGFPDFPAPHRAYSIMTDIAGLSWADDVRFAHRLIGEIGLATVPGSSFYSDPSLGRPELRFCCCKAPHTLEPAAKLIEQAGGVRPTRGTSG